VTSSSPTQRRFARTSKRPARSPANQSCGRRGAEQPRRPAPTNERTPSRPLADFAAWETRFHVNAYISKGAGIFPAMRGLPGARPRPSAGSIALVALVATSTSLEPDVSGPALVIPRVSGRPAAGCPAMIANGGSAVVRCRRPWAIQTSPLHSSELAPGAPLHSWQSASPGWPSSRLLALPVERRLSSYSRPIRRCWISSEADVDRGVREPGRADQEHPPATVDVAEAPAGDQADAE
jgi:hypothetical protein